jgi:hypothetical protein
MWPTHFIYFEFSCLRGAAPDCAQASLQAIVAVMTDNFHLGRNWFFALLHEIVFIVAISRFDKFPAGTACAKT